MTRYVFARYRLQNLTVMVAFRNIGYSIVLLIALLTQPKNVVGFLLIARGATDIGDPVASLISTGQLSAMAVTPLVGTVFTIL